MWHRKMSSTSAVGFYRFWAGSNPRRLQIDSYLHSWLVFYLLKWLARVFAIKVAPNMNLFLLDNSMTISKTSTNGLVELWEIAPITVSRPFSITMVAVAWSEFSIGIITKACWMLDLTNTMCHHGSSWDTLSRRWAICRCLGYAGVPAG